MNDLCLVAVADSIVRVHLEDLTPRTRSDFVLYVLGVLGVKVIIPMQVSVQFHSYFKDLTGCGQTVETLDAGTTLGALHEKLMACFPKLAQMKKSTLIAVGLDYQARDYVLRDGDEVSFFPPVQGG